MDERLIKILKDDPSFREFQAFIVSKIDELGDIQDLKGLSNQKAGETVRVRAEAITVLIDILRPFAEFNEKSEPTAKEIKAARERAGL